MRARRSRVRGYPHARAPVDDVWVNDDALQPRHARSLLGCVPDRHRNRGDPPSHEVMHQKGEAARTVGDAGAAEDVPVGNSEAALTTQ